METKQRWKVGELARRTGLTVRTLHHYDAIGLLSPGRRSEAGYRLYGPAEVKRLQQIVSLRRLGLSLEGIREFLARPGRSPHRVLRLHAERLREQIERQRRLCERLESLADALESAGGVSAEEFLKTIEAITMFDKYFTPEQRAEIEARGREVGPERIREVEAAWPALIAEVKRAMEGGTDPSSEPGQALGRRWMGLVREFTGGDPEIARSLRKMYDGEPQARERTGIDPAMFEWVQRAVAADPTGEGGEGGREGLA